MLQHRKANSSAKWQTKCTFNVHYRYQYYFDIEGNIKNVTCDYASTWTGRESSGSIISCKEDNSVHVACQPETRVGPILKRPMTCHVIFMLHESE